MTRGRASLRPLRRPVRPRDAHAGAGRARGGVGRGARRRRLPGRARRPAARLRRAPVAAVPRPPPQRGRRPAPVPQARGPQPHRRAQDQQRHRPGAAGPAHGQAAHHRRDRRGPARRRHRDRLRADGPRVRRLHGRRGHPPPGAQRPAHGAPRRDRVAGRRRRADAQGGGVRGDPRLGDQRRHARTTSSARPSARRPTRRSCATCSASSATRRAPRSSSARGACPTASSPASAAAPTRSASSRPSSATRASALIGVEAGGEALEPGRHGAPLTVAGRPGVLHGSLSAVLQDEMGQILEAHSISAGLDYPGSGPEHAHLRDIGRATLPHGLRRRGPGDLPARHPPGGDHPRARDRPRPAPRAAAGRLGDRHRVLLGARRQGPGRGPGSPTRSRARVTANRGPDAAGAEAIAAAFAAEGRRAALMPYMMGGFPDMDDVAAHRRGLRRRRRRPRRARLPVQRPAGRRPGRPRRRDRRAARRGDDARGPRRRARAGRARPGGGHGLREPRAWRAASSASPTTSPRTGSPG